MVNSATYLPATTGPGPWPFADLTGYTDWRLNDGFKPILQLSFSLYCIDGKEQPNFIIL